MYGIENSPNSKEHRATVEKFILHVDILPWDQSAAEHYGKIRAELQKKGSSIKAMDMIIGFILGVIKGIKKDHVCFFVTGHVSFLGSQWWYSISGRLLCLSWATRSKAEAFSIKWVPVPNEASAKSKSELNMHRCP
jgi:hypothetical protein